MNELEELDPESTGNPDIADDAGWDTGHNSDAYTAGERVGPEIDHAVEGQPVSVVFDGVFVRTDPVSHDLVVKGHSRGSDHVPWTMHFHWSTLLFERPTR